MPAFRTNPIPLDRAFRAVVGLAGILLLLLQMLGPALASPGQGVWMEICSEAGAVWVQIEPEEGTTDPAAPCPKCADCALCAVTGAAPLPNLPELGLTAGVQTETLGCRNLYKSYYSARLWPETRGPPSASQDKTERASRASMASIQVFGGAP